MWAVVSGALADPLKDLASYNIPRSIFFGIHVHDVTNIGQASVYGFGGIRLWDSGVQWKDIQKSPGAWNFERLDNAVNTAKRNGLRVLLPLGLTPQWAAARPQERSAYGPGNASEPKDIKLWKNYVRSVVTRYGNGIESYEIWNEPNSRLFFSGSIEKLVELTCSAYAIIKEIQPAAVVVAPAFTGKQNIPLAEVFLRAGGRACVDVMAFHFYAADSAPEALVSQVLELRRAMKRSGADGLPIWNTESGWTIQKPGVLLESPANWRKLDMRLAGAYMIRSFIIARSLGVLRYYWYAWDNKNMGVEDTMVQIENRNWQHLIEVDRKLAPGRSPKCSVRGPLWQCEFLGVDGSAKTVIWSSDDVSRRVSYEELGLGGGGSTTHTVTQSEMVVVGAMPVFLEKQN